ncbi:TetR/AcrR family transcriptional regulator [Dactylosporangium roseum]|uniref:TetR/AcrR family transcriptional regulator n=1 Tax=Dactylosporangium roseum TaxID=47989 RepID=A0ABY5ZC10_9ACTN|nr:TetR/AcrR family transcriptional regulator [Dactylosporangium roseum]UWZ39106.1 TetR/AcrR family transcriptional regulator [Dactylosporangium roseum]
MPKIRAGTVREHRAQRLDQLVDAAEAIMAEHGVDGLTAGAVATRAGIARNSIYRYFDSIDELIELVVTREFPAWVSAVGAAVEAERTPQARAVAYVRTNLELAARGSHGRRAALSRGALSVAGRQRVKDLHGTLNAILATVIDDLEAAQPDLLQAVLQALVDAGIRRIDVGDEPPGVIDYACDAAGRLVD